MVSPWVLWAFLVAGRMRKSESRRRKSLQQLEHPADAQTRSWEDNSKSRNVLQRKPSWSNLFICVSHIGVKSSLMSSIPLLLSIAFLPSALCIVEAAGLRQRSPAECRVLLWVLTSLHSSDFHCLEFVLSQRSFWSAAYPLSCFWKHTHTQWCILHINLSDSVCWLVAKVSFEFRGSELLRPKITHETWERNRTSSHT